MRLYQRNGSTTWWADWRDQNGKRHRKSTGTKDKALADALAAKWTHQSFLEKHFGAMPEIPFRDTLLRYAQYKERENPSSYKNTGKYRLQLLLDRFGELNLSEIDVRKIEDFASERRATVKEGSVQRELTVLKAILNRAHREGTLVSVPLFPRMRKQRGRKRWLSVKEEQRLIAAAANHLKPLIGFAVDTGGRRSELLRLDWRHVDMERGFITFIDTKNGEDRSVRLTNRAYQLLVSLGAQETGPVFTYQGKAMKAVTSSFKGARTRAKIDDLRFHDLRHTFASRLVQQGVSLYEVMHLTGHKSLEMVQRYAHLAPDFQGRAIEALNSYGTNLAQSD
ncbi:MAG: site-specific integrase [Rhodobacteraceae bacterium]|nr:site-specific integrase [Paracoccaceae bacterium]